MSVLALQMMGLWSFGTIAYTVNVIAVNLKVSFTRIILSCLIEVKELDGESGQLIEDDP